jgi:hypothetical protein
MDPGEAEDGDEGGDDEPGDYTYSDLCPDGNVLYVSRSARASRGWKGCSVVRWNFAYRRYDDWEITAFDWPVQKLRLAHLSGTTNRMATADGSYSDAVSIGGKAYRFIFRVLVWEFAADSDAPPRMLASISPRELFRDQPHGVAAKLFSGSRLGCEAELLTHEISADGRCAAEELGFLRVCDAVRPLTTTWSHESVCLLSSV